MCLYKGTNKHKIAQKDIVCYKLIKRSEYRCTTYYQGCSIYSGFPLRPCRSVPVEEMDNQSSLSFEVIHAFRNKRLNENLIAEIELPTILDNLILSEQNQKDVALMECIIPKGTVYYENIPDTVNSMNVEPQYGATEIIPVKIIKYYTHFVKEHK